MTTPIHPSPQVSLQKIAYRLLEKCSGFFLDYEQYRCRKSTDGHEGTRVYYMVDFDIVALYLNPRTSCHYANFLDGGDEEPSCVATAFLLGDYFFSPARKRLDLSPMPSFFLTEPHNEELMDGLAHFAGAAAETSLDFSETEMNNLIQLAQDVLAKCEPENRLHNLVDGLSTNVMSLLNIYDAALGKFSVLERFSSIREGGLRKLDNVNWYSELGFNPFPDMTESQDRQYMNKYVVDWSFRLRGTGKDKNIKNDAIALATLQFANESLQKEGNDVRFCLITGAASIFSAAFKWDEDFARHYLRHPQAFLMDQDFFAPELMLSKDSEKDDPIESRTLKLFDWLNLCLPRKVKESLELNANKVNPKALSHIRETTIQDPAMEGLISAVARSERGGISDREMILNLKKEIETHAASVYGDLEKLTVSGTQNDAASRLAKMLNDLYERNSLDVKSLRSAFDAELLSMLDDIYIEAGWYSIVQGAGGEAHLKGVPALCFDAGFEKATRAKDRLIEYFGHGNELSDGELRSIYDEIIEQDKTKYHACLIFALMFSLKGYWLPASSLAERAIQISDGVFADSSNKLDPKNERLKGREAAYLAAVAKRRLIRDATDLDKAAGFLEIARSRVSGDASDYPIRFESEALAIATRRILLDHYCGFVSAVVPTPEALEVMENIVRLIEEGQDEDRIDVSNWIIRQGTVNYLNLLVVLHELGEDIQKYTKGHRWVLEMLSPLLEDDIEANADPHACQTYLVGLALLSDERTEMFRTLTRFQRFVEIRGHMPYDAKRREAFKKIIDSRRDALNG